MLDPSLVRPYFPALNQTQDGQPVVFWDNPSGTQCPKMVIDAVSSYLLNDNTNHGGAFATSLRSNAMLLDTHQEMADMLGAASADEIVFGTNMTTLTFSISRALGPGLKPGDESGECAHNPRKGEQILSLQNGGRKVRPYLLLT